MEYFFSNKIAQQIIIANNNVDKFKICHKNYGIIIANELYNIILL